ncbi:MAG: class I SAM-dependent methyltransferase [Caldilineaceae bacterium]|nr:class I SAM-dependent methyltransferase [Caldilineaceae bacterium]
MGILRAVQNVAAWSGGSAAGYLLSERVACLQDPRPMPHQFAKMLDHPLRMAYRNPTALFDVLAIQPGMTVLDLGCGTGVFTVEMARRVGDEGRVHAVDIQAPLLEQAQKRLTAAGLAARVEFHHAGANSLPLPDNAIDIAAVIATLTQTPDRYGALRELRRVLRFWGRLMISEEMPNPAYVPPGLIRTWAEEAEFGFMAQLGTLFCYNLLFEKY